MAKENAHASQPFWHGQKVGVLFTISIRPYFLQKQLFFANILQMRLLCICYEVIWAKIFANHLKWKFVEKINGNPWPKANERMSLYVNEDKNTIMTGIKNFQNASFFERKRNSTKITAYGQRDICRLSHDFNMGLCSNFNKSRMFFNHCIQSTKLTSSCPKPKKALRPNPSA